MINNDIPRRFFALEACAEMVLQQVGNGPIAAVVATVRPLAVAEATEPATILLILSIDLPEEQGEGILGRLLVRGSSDGGDGRMKSGVVRRIEFGSKTGEIDSEVISLGVRK